MKRPSRRVVAGTALAAAALTTAALSTAVAGPADAATVSHCTGSQLVMGYQTLGPVDGHAGIVMEFRNRGTSTCSITGYPGFKTVSKNGKELRRAGHYFMGYFGGSKNRTVPTVNVQPSHYASAIAEWETVSTTGVRNCLPAPGFDFTPAGTSKTMHRTDVHPSRCKFEVHPTAYGRAGQHA